MISKSPSYSVWLADASMVICAFFWGLGFAAMKGALAAYPTYWILFFRFLGGAFLVGACFFKRVRNAARGDLGGGAVIGLFLFLAMSIQTVGLHYTTAGKQAFLTASYVIMVPLLLWALRRVFPGWVAIAGALVCFTGMGLLTSDVSGPLNIGDVLTAVSALFFAGQIISIGYYAKDGDPLVLTFVQLLVCAVLSLGAALIFNDAPSPKGAEGLIEIAYVTVFSTFLCFMIQNVAQKYTPAAHASILLGLESVFGLLGGIVILKEVFTLRMSLGCFLIFSAVLLVELKREGTR